MQKGFFAVIGARCRYHNFSEGVSSTEARAKKVHPTAAPPATDVPRKCTPVTDIHFYADTPQLQIHVSCVIDNNHAGMVRVSQRLGRCKCRGAPACPSCKIRTVYLWRIPQGGLSIYARPPSKLYAVCICRTLHGILSRLWQGSCCARRGRSLSCCSCSRPTLSYCFSR